MKKFIVVSEYGNASFEQILDGLSEQGYELEPSTTKMEHDEDGDVFYFALMSKEIE